MSDLSIVLRSVDEQICPKAKVASLDHNQVMSLYITINNNFFFFSTLLKILLCVC